MTFVICGTQTGLLLTHHAHGGKQATQTGLTFTSLYCEVNYTIDRVIYEANYNIDRFMGLFISQTGL